MLFHLFQRLRGEFGAFNVFRYVSTRTMLATLTSLSITFLVAPWFIRRARARHTCNGAAGAHAPPSVR